MLDLIPSLITKGMDFVPDIALAFIAFDVGRYLKIAALKQNGFQVLIITLSETIVTAVIVTVSMIYFFKLPVAFSLLLGAIGSATAPASTIMTIRQYRAKGNFVNTVLQVVALDDAIALIAFSACASVIQELNSNTHLNIAMFFVPVLLNLIAIILGMISGIVLDKIVTKWNSKDNRLVLTIGTIFFATGFCATFDISPLLTCMALGTTYITVSDSTEIFRQVRQFSPPIIIMFFVLSGMRLSIPMLYTAGAIGVTYFLIRIIGKYIGAFIGAILSNASVEARKYLGLVLVPQAGVSIGLAVLGQRILPDELGSLLSTIILSSSVLYEMVGPVLAKLGLKLAKSFSCENAASENMTQQEILEPTDP